MRGTDRPWRLHAAVIRGWYILRCRAVEGTTGGDPVAASVNTRVLRDARRRLAGRTRCMDLQGLRTAMRLRGKRGPACRRLPLRTAWPA
jgi:hypothetical protein